MNVIKPGISQNYKLAALETQQASQPAAAAEDSPQNVQTESYQPSERKSFRMPSAKTLLKGALAVGAGVAFAALVPGPMVLGALAGGAAVGAASVVKEQVSDMFSLNWGYKPTLSDSMTNAAKPAAVGAALGTAAVGVAIGSAPLVGSLALGGAAVYGVVKGGQVLADRLNPLNW